MLNIDEASAQGSLPALCMEIAVGEFRPISRRVDDLPLRQECVLADVGIERALVLDQHELDIR